MLSRRGFLKMCVSAAGTALVSQVPGISQLGGYTKKPLLLSAADDCVVDAALTKVSTGYTDHVYISEQMFPEQHVESLLLGIGRYDPRILNNYGIRVNMSDLGGLTGEEKREAFMARVMAELDPETQERVKGHFA